MRGVHWSPVYFPHKSVCRGALMFSFFDLRLNKRLSKKSRRRWFEAPSAVTEKTRQWIYPSKAFMIFLYPWNTIPIWQVSQWLILVDICHLWNNASDLQCVIQIHSWPTKLVKPWFSNRNLHNYVKTWQRFPHYRPFARRIYQSLLDLPLKRPVKRSLMFCRWIRMPKH